MKVVAVIENDILDTGPDLERLNPSIWLAFDSADYRILYSRDLRSLENGHLVTQNVRFANYRLRPRDNIRSVIGRSIFKRKSLLACVYSTNQIKTTQ
ncbi:hypothetical protein DPMN_145066 [Dreissena polymorpha]|uniref:Uncharacterized protein n=1 Tax=Dreissena polymorpha TaxID=45954 RepID=A0A9D4F4D5_DREPO|nr:hypothetical protein DPMN_145066 [Dreissena polymorpha]